VCKVFRRTQIWTRGVFASVVAGRAFGVGTGSGTKREGCAETMGREKRIFPQNGHAKKRPGKRPLGGAIGTESRETARKQPLGGRPAKNRG